MISSQNSLISAGNANNFMLGKVKISTPNEWWWQACYCTEWSS